jgi:cadmium resistance protein CadD (predicted permease)
MNYVPLIIFLVVIVALGFSAHKLKDRFEILGEFIVFLRERNLWWIMPLLVVFALAGLFVVITGNSAVGAFIYTLF